MKIGKVLMLASVLVLLLPLAAWSAGGQEAASTDFESMEPLTFAIGSPPGREPYQESLFIQEWQKRSGVKFELMKLSSSGISQQVNTMVASGDIPDCMSIPRGTAEEYGMQGAFLAVNSYFDSAPNLKKTLNIDKNPWIYAQDQNLYALPMSQSPYLQWGWLYRLDWSRKLGIDPPRTLDDWLEAWRKVKDDDPESVPWFARGTGLPFSFLKPAFGIGYVGGNNLAIKNGQMVDVSGSDEMQQLITFMNTTYEEGLLWNQFLEATTELRNQVIGSGKVYSITDYQDVAFSASYGRAYVGEDILDNTIPIPPPKGPDGHQGTWWMGTTSGWCVAINANGDNVPAAVQMWDYYFSDEGQELFVFGVEGETFNRTGDGGYEFTDKVKQEAEENDIALENHMAQKYNLFLFFIGPGPGFGPVKQAQRWEALEMHPNYNKGRAIVAKYLCPVNPPMWLAREDTQRLNDLNNNLNTYREEWFSKFIVGQEPLSKWGEYIEGLKKLGIEEVESLANKGYQNYLDAVGKSRPFAPTVEYEMSNLYDIVGLENEYIR